MADKVQADSYWISHPDSRISSFAMPPRLLSFTKRRSGRKSSRCQYARRKDYARRITHRRFHADAE